MMPPTTSTNALWTLPSRLKPVASPKYALPQYGRTIAGQELAICRVNTSYMPLFSSNIVSQSHPLPEAGSTRISDDGFYLSKQPIAAVNGALGQKTPDDRTLRLGRTIRILHERLPALLHSPLPQEVLSPAITLCLFPSTHPHLPTVSGRIPYAAALWTSPVAWGRFPVVGNVKLIILTERLIKHGGSGKERLIVKWRTCGKEDPPPAAGANGRWTAASNASADDTHWTRILSSVTGSERAFTGLFLFEFDDAGRISSHTIEHAEEGGNWMRTTSAVISVTDWLLGRAWARQEEGKLILGCSRLSASMHRAVVP